MAEPTAEFIEIITKEILSADPKAAKSDDGNFMSLVGTINLARLAALIVAAPSIANPEEEKLKLKQEVDRYKHLLASFRDNWLNIKITAKTPQELWEEISQKMKPYIDYINNCVALPQKYESPCLLKAADDEPIFILRGQDLLSAKFVRDWAEEAKKNGLPEAKYNEALELADKMDKWPNRKYPD